MKFQEEPQKNSLTKYGLLEYNSVFKIPNDGAIYIKLPGFTNGTFAYNLSTKSYTSLQVNLEVEYYPDATLHLGQIGRR